MAKRPRIARTDERPSDMDRPRCAVCGERLTLQDRTLTTSVRDDRGQWRVAKVHADQCAAQAAQRAREEDAMKVPEKNVGGEGTDLYGRAYDKSVPPPPPPAAKAHNAVLVDYHDMGVIERDVFGKPGEKEKVDSARFIYQVGEVMPDGRRYLVAFKPFGIKKSMHENSAMRQHLESLAARTFEVGEDVEPESFVGRPCVLIVTHKKNADGTRTYANVDSVGPHMEGLPALEPVGYVRFKDRGTSTAPDTSNGADADIPF